MNRIAVLLTCHNRKEQTLSCLNSLYIAVEQAKEYFFDIFLIDDGSTDNTGDAVKFQYPNVRVIEGNGNLYWNRGMHLAWEVASTHYDYDFYIWLNDDTYVFPKAIKELLNASHTTDNTSIIVAPACSKVSGELTYSGFSATGNKIKPINALIEARTFNGNFILVPKAVFKVLGNLDPLFHHSIGDFDYGFRAFECGIKSYVAPNFLAYCEGHNSDPVWCRIEVPFKKRILSLYSPLGNSHPYYYFRYELRHYGILIALKHLFSIHLRLLFPRLWN